MTSGARSALDKQALIRTAPYVVDRHAAAFGCSASRPAWSPSDTVTPPGPPVPAANQALNRAFQRDSSVEERQSGCALLSLTPGGGLSSLSCLASREASRGGLTAEIHAVVDASRSPIEPALAPGHHHHGLSAGDLLDDVPERGTLRADEAYDSDAIRLLATPRGGWASIPPRRNRRAPIRSGPDPYRDRNPVERFLDRIRHCRRVATRYEQSAANCLAFVKLAAIRRWLRVHEASARNCARAAAIGLQGPGGGGLSDSGSSVLSYLKSID